ncbi:hypothetical protein [Thalassotalea sp. PS06]|uniref:hypothetical protein n=1 Tax=Thalassotalea sp. PS06 TaxID=2594005 RepID=UPI0011638977|nr:hypothetical protein [Thalassotalea sp. PS06]QDP02309.1 hypothetical protein FNC98_13725 [Thalassotalea sp. PS06]
MQQVQQPDSPKKLLWRTLLKQGNDFYSKEQWLNAELVYFQAYEVLSKECQNYPNDTDTLMAWICTCHNLSTLFEAQGELRTSLHYLLLPQDYCRALLEKNESCEEVRLLAIQALSVTWTPIVEFSKKYPNIQHCGQNAMKHTTSPVNRGSKAASQSMLH